MNTSFNHAFPAALPSDFTVLMSYLEVTSYMNCQHIRPSNISPQPHKNLQFLGTFNLHPFNNSGRTFNSPQHTKKGYAIQIVSSPSSLPLPGNGKPIDNPTSSPISTMKSKEEISNLKKQTMKRKEKNWLNR